MTVCDTPKQVTAALLTVKLFLQLIAMHNFALLRTFAASLGFILFVPSPSAAASKLPAPIKETCGLTDLTIEFRVSPIVVDQATVTITAMSNNVVETRSVLTFDARSFGYECRKNLLNWGGYVVFQTACPARTGIHDPFEPCDFKNNFGIIFGSTVLAVPHAKNGAIAAEVFQAPKNKKIPALLPVKIIYRGSDD